MRWPISSLLTGMALSWFTYAPLAAAQTGECTTLKASGNAEYPPYLWRSAADPAQLIGAVRLLIDDLANEIGIPITLTYSGPWGRVQEEVAAGRVDMIAGAFFTEPRTRYMDYLYPEFQGTQTSVWVNEDKPFAFNVWHDLKAYQGVTVINNSFGQEFDEFAKSQLNISQVASLEQGLRMVSAQRADYLLYEEEPGRAYAEQLAVTKLVTLPTEVTRQNLYLTLSKKSACNSAELKAKLAQALETFARDQRMEGYLQQAHELWASQQAKQ